jgi:hypothetical protein
MGIQTPPSQGIVCIFIWRRIPSEIISQPEPGVVFEHSLLHSKLEYPDLPQPPKWLPVTGNAAGGNGPSEVELSARVRFRGGGGCRMGTAAAPPRGLPHMCTPPWAALAESALEWRLAESAPLSSMLRSSGRRAQCWRRSLRSLPAPQPAHCPRSAPPPAPPHPANLRCGCWSLCTRTKSRPAFSSE